jgi:hypothetical protein
LPEPEAVQVTVKSVQLTEQYAGGGAGRRDAATCTEPAPIDPLSSGRFQNEPSETFVGVSTEGLKDSATSNPLSSSEATMLTLTVVENDWPGCGEAPDDTS